MGPSESSVREIANHDRIHRLWGLCFVITLLSTQIRRTDEALYSASIGKAVGRQNEFLIRPHANDIRELTSEKYLNFFEKGARDASYSIEGLPENVLGRELLKE